MRIILISRMGMLRRAVADQTREAQRGSARERTDYEGCRVARGCVRKTEVESVAPPLRGSGRGRDRGR